MGRKKPNVPRAGVKRWGKSLEPVSKEYIDKVLT